MSYIFQYDPQYSPQKFKESDIVEMVKKYELAQMTDWLKNGPPDKKRASMAFKECLKNDWLVGLDLIVNSGWSKEKKLITDGWMELLCINLHERNKENSQSEMWLVQKTFNNKSLFSKSQLNKLSVDMLGLANAFMSQHYWNLFRPYVTNLIIVDGHHFFRDLYYHYSSPPYSPLHTNKKGNVDQIKSFHLANIEDVLKLTIHIDNFLIWDILEKDHNDELFFKIIESPIFINTQELMGLAIYVPMYFRIYQQGMKKVSKSTIDAKIERLVTALKKLNIPEYEEYTYHVLNAYHSLVRQNNGQHFTAGPFDIWNHSKLDSAYHLPTLNIKSNESVRVYFGDCIYAEPNSNNIYELLSQEQKDEYRQRIKNRP